MLTKECPEQRHKFLNSYYYEECAKNNIGNRKKNVTNKPETNVFCKPIYKPIKTYKVNSAGAESTLTDIYFVIKS